MRILRWVAVLPVSILASIIANLLLIFAWNTSGYFDGEYALILSFASYFAGGMAYMFAGVYVSPSHKINTAKALLIIGCLLTIVSLAFRIIITEDYITSISNIGFGIGIILGYFDNMKRERKNNQ